MWVYGWLLLDHWYPKEKSHPWDRGSTSHERERLFMIVRWFVRFFYVFLKVGVIGAVFHDTDCFTVVVLILWSGDGAWSCSILIFLFIGGLVLCRRLRVGLSVARLSWFLFFGMVLWCFACDSFGASCCRLNINDRPPSPGPDRYEPARTCWETDGTKQRSISLETVGLSLMRGE